MASTCRPAGRRLTGSATGRSLMSTVEPRGNPVRRTLPLSPAAACAAAPGAGAVGLVVGRDVGGGRTGRALGTESAAAVAGAAGTGGCAAAESGAAGPGAAAAALSGPGTSPGTRVV